MGIFHSLQEAFFRSGCRKEDSFVTLLDVCIKKCSARALCIAPSDPGFHVFGLYCTELSYFFIHTGPLRPGGSKAYESTYYSRHFTLVWFRCKRRRVPTWFGLCRWTSNNIITPKSASVIQASVRRVPIGQSSEYLLFYLSSLTTLIVQGQVIAYCLLREAWTPTDYCYDS